MACGTTCAQRTADRKIAAYEEGKPYTRREIFDALYLDGGSALYLVSDSVIPEGITVVKTPYGDRLPVLRLKRKYCQEDGVLMHKADWAGVEPGEYIEDRTWLKVAVLGDEPITQAESRQPYRKLVKPRRFTVEFIGRFDAEWTIDENGVMHRPHRSADAPITDGIVDEETALDTYKLRMDKLREFLTGDAADLYDELFG